MAPGGSKANREQRMAAAAAVGLGPNSNWAQIQEAQRAQQMRSQQQATAQSQQRTQQAQQAQAAANDAAEAERIRQERIQAENDRAMQLMQQSFANAQASMEQQNQMQMMQDQQAIMQANAASASAGAEATGGAMAGAVSMKRGRAQQDGADVSANYPTNIPPITTVAANQLAGNSPNRANQFNIPNVTGIVYGGV